MIIQRHHFHISLVSITAGLITCLTLVANTSVVTPQATNIPNCSPSLSVTQPLNSAVLQGTANLEVTNNGGTPVSSIEFLVDGQAAAGTIVNSGAYWRIGFNTTTIPNGPHDISAIVRSNTGTALNQVCVTSKVAVSVQNPVLTTSDLVVIPSQINWQGPTNFPYNFTVNADLLTNNTRQSVTTQASYRWTTNIGTIKPSGNSAAFYSGPSMGKGQITITASYGTLQRSAVINLTVDSAATTSNYPQPATTGQNGAPTTVAGPGGSQTTPSSSNSAGAPIPQKDDSQLASCLTHVIGAEKYRQLAAENRRLEYAAIAKAEQCFARSNYLIPSNLAPTAPTEVKRLRIDSKQAAISGVKRTVVNGKESLVLSGNSLPNQTMLIYIFSEPLVLTTKSDENGRWTYALQNPLDGGEHEAYATVQGDNNQPVRSNGFAFAIASAARTEQNPLGLSLQLKNNGSSSYYILYIASAGIFVAVAIGVALYTIRRVRKNKDSGLSPPGIPNVQG